MKVIVLSPHPDDETIGAGGTIYKLKRKHDVVVYCITSGNKVRVHGMTPSEVAEVRFEEFRKVMDELGVNYRWLSFDDLTVMENINSIFRTIYEDLEAGEKYLILTPSKYEKSHPDHRGTWMVANMLYQHLKFHSEVTVLGYEVWDFIPYPVVFVPLTRKEMSAKMKLLRHYRVSLRGLDLETVRARARARAFFMPEKYYEVFTLEKSSTIKLFDLSLRWLGVDGIPIHFPSFRGTQRWHNKGARSLQKVW